MMNPVIDMLQHKRLIWQGAQTNNPSDSISSGYPQLDNQLGGGFPLHGVIEIISASGIGELRLLTPYILAQGENRLTVFINPSGYLCADYFTQQGIDLSRMLMLFPKTAQEALWAAEQCLKSGCCGSVSLWHSELEIHQAKRLQVASETGQCLNFLFKTASQSGITLPISLSLTLNAGSEGLHISIHKRKGGWLKSSLTLDVHKAWPHLVRYQPESASVVPLQRHRGRA
ncbi:translesion DNA synthesis-associated protein ImuA [Vibrio sp. SCSIO 43137]|uniref:translesion DNA synthesis-associated protein ImuA n=1 Tax=Vibrio sp. SCSIO 43137 TaxID=3021011 RepID=UPI00230796EC|nr:translesion DNA synthesis-associated protein ImuA [Vibrio sp. SCSIO 43137]WCE30653.1 translesion DNA synthesis-associated protein ImuA [Vibrio sp. SCSIO 43137]